MNIRLLKENEIEVRVQSYNANSGKAIFLLYKDARCDMKILDEVFGIDGWEREHQLIDGKLFCTVKIWSDKRNCWIAKQDVGTESNTEKEKGQASDAFKRACFNIGIGRELYSSPTISVQCTDKDLYNGKCTLKLSVKHIAYDENREIKELILVDRFGKERFNWSNGKSNAVATSSTSTENVSSNSEIKLLSEAQEKRLFAIAYKAGIKKEQVLKAIVKDYSVDDVRKLNKTQYDELCSRLEAKIAK